jgi:hypothetical protein
MYPFTVRGAPKVIPSIGRAQRFPVLCSRSCARFLAPWRLEHEVGTRFVSPTIPQSDLTWADLLVQCQATFDRQSGKLDLDELLMRHGQRRADARIAIGKGSQLDSSSHQTPL